MRRGKDVAWVNSSPGDAACLSGGGVGMVVRKRRVVVGLTRRVGGAVCVLMVLVVDMRVVEDLVGVVVALAQEQCDARRHDGHREPVGPPEALALGSVSYGASVVLNAYALRLVGAAQEAAYFATAPFLGALAATALTGERRGDAG
jgi:drug/metabolite transporter (DMT)-like permease